MSKIKDIINTSIAVKEQLINDDIVSKIDDVINVCVSALKQNNAIYFCGNGGSAADAQHLAAELSGRFYKDRDPLPSEALHVNTSYLTAVANDYGFQHVYSRMIKGIGKSGDVLIGLSTSGKSENVVKAFEMAKRMNIHTVGLTGREVCDFNRICDITINVPSTDTPRIQETHILVGHIICQIVEEKHLIK